MATNNNINNSNNNAAARATSSAELDSSGSSCAELPHVELNKQIPLPEKWTLPHEWNIEKREMFENWKMDVQSQIANLASNLEVSLQVFPHPDVNGRVDFQHERQRALFEQAMSERRKMAGNTLLYGLARIQHPDMQ